MKFLCLDPTQQSISKILLAIKTNVIFVCNLTLASKRRHKELKRINSRIKLKDVKKALRMRNKLDKKRSDNVKQETEGSIKEKGINE